MELISSIIVCLEYAIGQLQIPSLTSGGMGEEDWSINGLYTPIPSPETWNPESVG